LSNSHLRNDARAIDRLETTQLVATAQRSSPRPTRVMRLETGRQCVKLVINGKPYLVRSGGEPLLPAHPPSNLLPLMELTS
jgi:hypothetical protein